MARRGRRRRAIVTFAGLGAALLLALVSLRGTREAAPAAALIGAIEGAPSVEMTFRVDLESAAGAAFNEALSTLVLRLIQGGARIGRVLPDPGRAAIEGDGLDEPRLRRAIEGLPIELVEPPSSGRAVVRAAAAGETDPPRGRLIERTAVALRSAVQGSAACGGCEPTVDVDDASLRLRLPWIDDVTEQALLAHIRRARLPAPVVLVERRVITGAAARGGDL